MRLYFGRDPAPTEAEWSAVVDGLWDGDPVMDALLEWMNAYGAQEGRALFERALERGVDSIPNAPEPLRVFFAAIEKDPPWLDRKLMEEGVSFVHRVGMAGPYVLRDMALMGGYLLSAFNQTLVLTGALKKSAGQRIAETGKWWIDCTEHGGMERFSPGFKTTIRVRMVHALVRRNLPRRKEWDSDKYGLPVNQIDMAATYLAFGPAMLLGIRLLGIPVLPHEARAVLHLFKYAAGWLMGVDERWLVDTERQGLLLLYHSYMTQSRPDWTSKELGRALAHEPLERRLPHLEAWPRLHALRLRLQYQQHLSVSSLVLNRERRVALGLPEFVVPWFPLALAGPRFAFYTAHRFVPMLCRLLEDAGRAEQIGALNIMFGDQPHAIIKPDRAHPAFA